MLEAVLRAYIRAPSHPAKYRIERWLGRLVLPPEGGVFTVDGNLRLKLHTRDWIEYVLIREGRYEPLTLAFIKANLRPGHTCLLAGVGLGLHVVVASRAVGEAGLVLGVDPQVRALQRTRVNLRLNTASANVRLLPAALGRSVDVSVLGEPPSGNLGTAHLRAAGIGPMCALTATAGTIWRAVAQTKAPHVFLLDVEGFEERVLQGFDVDFRPQILVVELWDEFLRDIGSSSVGVCSLLRRMGYDLFTLHGESFAPGADLPEHNVVAVHASSRMPVFSGIKV